MKREVMVFVLAALFATSAQESFAADTLHQAIQEREDQWSAAYNAHDVDSLAAIYGEDAVLVPPGSMPVRGRSEIGKTLASLFPLIRDLKLVADGPALVLFKDGQVVQQLVGVKPKEDIVAGIEAQL